MPASCSHWIRMGWEMVSKAMERSSRMMAAVSPLSMIIQMSSVAAMRAVLWLGLNPDRVVSRNWLSFRWVTRYLSSFPSLLPARVAGR